MYVFLNIILSRYSSNNMYCNTSISYRILTHLVLFIISLLLFYMLYCISNIYIIE